MKKFSFLFATFFILFSCSKINQEKVIIKNLSPEEENFLDDVDGYMSDIDYLFLIANNNLNEMEHKLIRVINKDKFSDIEQLNNLTSLHKSMDEAKEIRTEIVVLSQQILDIMVLEFENPEAISKRNELVIIFEANYLGVINRSEKILKALKESRKNPPMMI